MSRILAFGPVEENAQAQLEMCLEVSEEGARGVLCADHHKGYSMPIGGVLASKEYIMPAGVGFDIACGNCAVRTDILASDINTAFVMDEIWKTIAFGIGQKNGEKVDHPVLDEIHKSGLPIQRNMVQMAANQLGTVGSGNHYVDLFEDRADGALWVGVHFGSRGFGHKTATHFLNLAAQEHGQVYKDDMDAPPHVLKVGTQLADDYLYSMKLAGDYAYAGRNWVVDRVLKMLDARATMRVHNHHNFAWLERGPDGQAWWVVRKGATPAYPGQRGFIGGSMGDDAVIVEGIESELGEQSFYSTVHGAGRVMGRKQAAGVTRNRRQWFCGHRGCPIHATGVEPGTAQRGKDGSRPKCPNCNSSMNERHVQTVVRPGKVDWASWQARLATQGVEVRGGGADEAPECYKRLPEVLGYHQGTIEVLHTLRPIGVAMAGADVVDPYKD